MPGQGRAHEARIEWHDVGRPGALPAALLEVGEQQALRLRGEASLVGVPIVAITAEGDRDTSLAVGCTGFIPWCSDYPDTQTLELFATKVMPNFR